MFCDIDFELFWRDVVDIPVSYTHLDVYKRQTQNTAKYNVQQFTSYRTKHNNLDTLNAKIDYQRGVYGQDIAYAKYKPHQKVIVNAKKIKYKGRLYRNPDNLKPNRSPHAWQSQTRNAQFHV